MPAGPLRLPPDLKPTSEQQAAQDAKEQHAPVLGSMDGGRTSSAAGASTSEPNPVAARTTIRPWSLSRARAEGKVFGWSPEHSKEDYAASGERSAASRCRTGLSRGGVGC